MSSEETSLEALYATDVRAPRAYRSLPGKVANKKKRDADGRELPDLHLPRYLFRSNL